MLKGSFAFIKYQRVINNLSNEFNQLLGCNQKHWWGLDHNTIVRVWHSTSFHPEMYPIHSYCFNSSIDSMCSKPIKWCDAYFKQQQPKVCNHVIKNEKNTHTKFRPYASIAIHFPVYVRVFFICTEKFMIFSVIKRVPAFIVPRS